MPVVVDHLLALLGGVKELRELPRVEGLGFRGFGFRGFGVWGFRGFGVEGLKGLKGFRGSRV